MIRPLILFLVLAFDAGAVRAREILHDAEPGFGFQEALKEKNEFNKIAFFLGDGIYFITKPLRLENIDRVGFIARDGTRPVISGGKKINGWKQVEGNLWQAKLPEVAEGKWRFRELYVDQKPATRARHPDKGTFRIAAAGKDRRTSFRANEGDLQDWEDPGQIEFVFYHDWSLSRVRMKGIDHKNNTATLADPVGQTTAKHYAMDHFEKQPRYHLENHPDFLTAPGEWHLSEKTGSLTYLARDGKDPNQCEIIAPYADALMHIINSQHIDFEGVTFAHANWQLPPGGSAGVQAAFHQVRPGNGVYENRREAKPAAIEIGGSSNVVFKGCQFRGLTASGLWVRDGCKEVTIEDCKFDEIGANAIMVGDQNPPKGKAATRVTIDACTIQNCGTTDYGAVGIWIGIANHITVRGCTLERLPYTGISVGWRWSPVLSQCHHNVIEDNHIHHIMQKLSDGGGIYTLGLQPGTKLLRNRIHDVPVNAGRAESNGIFFDQGTRGINAEGNTIYRIARSPLRFHQALNNTIRLNTLYRSKEDIPALRYNNTEPEKIRLQENLTPVGDGPVD